MSAHGIPLSKNGEVLDPSNPPMLADGVGGYAIEEGGIVYIPLVQASVEGDGRVGRWLDSLSKEHHIRFPTVMSKRIAGMLERRGFSLTQHDWGASYDRRPDSAILQDMDKGASDAQ